MHNNINSIENPAINSGLKNNYVNFRNIIIPPYEFSPYKPSDFRNLPIVPSIISETPCEEKRFESLKEFVIQVNPKLRQSSLCNNGRFNHNKGFKIPHHLPRILEHMKRS